VQQVLDAAHANGRRVVLLGRSMVRNMKIAADLGYLNVPDGVIVDLKKSGDIPDHRIVYMSTGSQGEPMAVLARMVNQEHQVEVGEGDTVILASSSIPGNETSIYRIIDGLMKLGANVVHKGNAKVHVSGHAAAGELLYCYNIVKPKNVMPIHGEFRMLAANAALAIETGVPQNRTVIAENGTVVDLADGVARAVGQIDIDFIYVDGKSVGRVTEEDLKDRMTLAEEGFISVITVVETSLAQIVSGPEIHAKGVAEEQKVFDSIKPQIADALEKAMQDGVSDHHQLQQIVRRTVGRWVGTKLRRKAMIVPVVVVV
jgi:ribonuclease J